LEAEARRFLHSPDAYSPTLEQSDQSRRKAQALIIGDRAKIAALDRVIAQEHARLGQLPSSSATYSWLRLQRDSAQADYLTLSSHRTAAVASRAEALSLGSVVVVDRAVLADTPRVGLGRAPLAIACSFFVMLLALGIAFLMEMLDPRLRRTEQFESLYGAPLLASLSGTEQSASVFQSRLSAPTNTER
jgi:hypothetical protein